MSLDKFGCIKILWVGNNCYTVSAKIRHDGYEYIWFYDITPSPGSVNTRKKIKTAYKNNFPKGEAARALEASSETVKVPAKNPVYIQCSVDTFMYQTPYLLGNLSTAPQNGAATEATKKKKKENTMCYYDDTCDCCEGNPTDTKTQYLIERLYSIRERKELDLRKQFYMLDDDAPRTPEELIERITKGLYIIPEKYKGKKAEDLPFTFICNATSYLSWRDPAKPADEKGFDAALVKLRKAFQGTLDEIKIGEPADGLKALREFEALEIS